MRLICFSGGLGSKCHGDHGRTRGAFNALGSGTYGDLSHVDANGYLYVNDRRTDLILTGGVNIYPQEIENVLAEHASVGGVAGIGVSMRSSATWSRRPWRCAAFILAMPTLRPSC